MLPLTADPPSDECIHEWEGQGCPILAALIIIALRQTLAVLTATSYLQLNLDVWKIQLLY